MRNTGENGNICGACRRNSFENDMFNEIYPLQIVFYLIKCI
jgi:hypothetical protein